MSWKIGKVTRITRTVVINQPTGDTVVVQKLKAGMNIYPNSEQIRLREELIREGSKDINLDFLKKHGISSIEDGPVFEDGEALTIDECLDVPYLRAGIESSYDQACVGIKVKN